MLVGSDVDDVSLPKLQDSLVTLNEARAGFKVLLGCMNKMFQGTHQTGSVLGPDMQAAFKVFMSSLLQHVCLWKLTSVYLLDTEWRENCCSNFSTAQYWRMCSKKSQRS